MNTTSKGKMGETEAAICLENDGYRIIERNYRSKRGEVDIIAGQGDCLVFIEVKTWDAFCQEDLEIAVGSRKRATIIGAAEIYLSSHPEYADHHVRFDLVLMNTERGLVRHLPDAFAETVYRW